MRNAQAEHGPMHNETCRRRHEIEMRREEDPRIKQAEDKHIACHGAGPNFDGTDAVHTHMTNSRLTDPEVLE